jgi:hypothetical protein
MSAQCIVLPVWMSLALGLGQDFNGDIHSAKSVRMLNPKKPSVG